MLDDILKNKSSDVKHKLLTIEDKNEGKHFLFWSALSHKRRLCEKLIRYIESCKQIENKEILFSVTLVGACTIQKNVSIVRELIKFGADVSFCNACRIEDTMRNDEKGIESSIDEQHMCPLDISMSYGNISHVENLLKHGATISHCSWRPWQIIHEAFALEKSGLYILFNEINDSCHDLKDIFLTFAKYGVLSTTLLNAFLECKVDANVTNRDKKNALHFLVDHSGLDISEKCKVIEKLLLNGCDANIKGKQQKTPLSLAIRKQYKHPQILQTLLKGNADVNIKVGEGKSLLHVCIETAMPPNDAINIIKILKDQKCDPFMVDKKGHSVIEILFQQDEINIDILSELCRYPLHTCLEYSKIPEERKLKIIRYLHGRGMDIDCRDEKEQTPLSTAITSCCSPSVIQCFLQLGASLNLKFGNDHSILQLFLRFHPDIDGRTIKEFVNQDVHLQSRNFLVIIADILKSSKNYHFVLKTILGQFSLESASFKSFLDEENQDISLVTALCENGAKTNAKDLDRNTPLHSCVASDSGDLIVLSVSKVLLKYAAKVEKCNNKKRTPLLLAVKQEKERIKTVTFLLSNNSDINVKDSKDESCLHYCIRKMIPDIDACKLLQILLESNPKLEHKNTLGLTALNLASTCNTFSRVSCIIRLLEKGAKVNSIDLYNRTPLFNVVRCLRGHDILLSLERIVRLAILFACHADPGYATKTNETVNDFETGDSVVKKHSPKHSFKFDLKELKKEISGTITEAIGYLGEIRFDIEEDDVCHSSDSVSSAQYYSAAVSKKGSQERRIILDLSVKGGAAVNGYIDKDSYLGNEVHLKYPNVDALVELIKKHGRNCFIFKRDLSRAYRQIFIDLHDVHLVGYKWNDHLYFDRVLSMGLRSAAHICQRVTNAVAFMYRQMGFDIVNYLDDFAGVESVDRADKAYIELKRLLDSCGLEESSHKAVPPSTRMEFLGIICDTSKLLLQIPDDRLKDIQKILLFWTNKRSAKLRDIQSLVGKLNFMASCVRPGRVFMSRLLNWLRSAYDQTGYIVVPS
ncbi:unnamed protein product [Mytilus edulis]|uniref:Reverse transcriptase domain-containing protein n=1 Tax=Mytilus edulis TaxID=6550 RepID=A0A8S3RKM3_MYTED|nr:unnamed protein product [Mytilus edulis]